MTNKVSITKEYLEKLFNSGAKIEDIAKQMSEDLDRPVSVKEAKDAFTKLGLDLRKKPRTAKIEWVIVENDTQDIEGTEGTEGVGYEVGTDLY